MEDALGIEISKGELMSVKRAIFFKYGFVRVLFETCSRFVYVGFGEFPNNSRTTLEQDCSQTRLKGGAI